MYKHKQTGIIVEWSETDKVYKFYDKSLEFYDKGFTQTVPKSIVENSNDWKKRVGEALYKEDLFEGEQVFSLNKSGQVYDFILGNLDYNKQTLFKTKEQAEHYQILNSEVLSLSDVDEYVGYAAYSKLEILVKSRL